MFPSANNMPYQPNMGQPNMGQPNMGQPNMGQPNMMGQSMGYNHPLPQGTMPPNMGAPPTYPPMPFARLPFPVPSSGYGAQPPPFNPGTSTSMYQAPGVTGGQHYTNQTMAGVSTYQNQYQGQGHNQGQSNTNTIRTSLSGTTGQRKDSVAKMTSDFIKHFREETAHLTGKSPLTIQSKAAQQRDGSPFSDVSDTEVTAVTGKHRDGSTPSKNSGPQSDLPKVRYQQGIAKKSSTAKNPISSTSLAKSSKAGSQMSSGMSSILKNYQGETNSSKDRKSSRETSRSTRLSRSISPDRSRGRGNRESGRRDRAGGDESSSQSRRRRKDDGLQDVSDDDPDPDPDHVQAQVFIGNLPEDISERDIHAYLVTYNDVDIWIGYHKRKEDDTCAFIKLPTMKDSKKLLSDIRSDIYKGQKLDVRFTAAGDFTDYHVRLKPRGKRSPKRNRSISPRRGRRSRSPRRARRSISPRSSRRSISPRSFRRSISPRSLRRSLSPRRDRRSESLRSNSPRGEIFEGQQQLFFPQEVQYVQNPDDSQGVQYIQNPGDPYGMPVYIMPPPIQPTQQVFIPSYDYPPSMDLQGQAPTHFVVDSYGNQQPAYFSRDGSQEGPHWREREREAEKERLSKTKFMEFVDTAFANAPILGKKYITEYLSRRELRAVYVCSVCMEISYDSEVADHVVGYRHRLKCFRKDQPEIYDKMCRIRNKSTMIMECARMAADNEISHEKITIQMCDDPEERGKKHLENIKDASYIGSSRAKPKDGDQGKTSKESSSKGNKESSSTRSKESSSTRSKESSSAGSKESSSGSSGFDIFKRIAMYKKKIEDSKKEENEDDAQKMSFETLATKNKTLADSIVAEISSKQQEEDRIREAEETEKERKREEEKINRLKEQKRKEEEMRKKLEEARQRVIENQKKMEESRLKKIEMEKKLKEDEEKRLLKLEEERIKEEKRKLAEQKRKLEMERKQLEQQKIAEAKRKALEAVKKHEDQLKAEEKRKAEAKRLEEAKRKEEEQKVELMLLMLENQKHAEEAQKLEEQRKLDEMKRQEAERKHLEEKHRQLWKDQQRALQIEAEEKKLAIKKAGEERQKAEQNLKEHQEKAVQEIKNRHEQLKLLQENEEKRQKELLASQKRAAALIRLEEMKKAKVASTSETSKTVTEAFPVIYDQKYYEAHEDELTSEQKLVHLRKRAYPTLPYSMEEKRMHLRTNIGPDDKLGPDPNSNIDAVLALKYNMKGAENPLIGLQYITEGFDGKSDGRKVHRYYCEICSVETFHCDGLLQHMIGFGHRMKYLEIHKVELHAELMQQDLRRATLSELVKKEAMKIEQESGRHQIPTLTMYEFRMYARKMKQVESAFKDPVPTMSENAANIKSVIQMSEKEEKDPTDMGTYDPTLNVQGIVNKTLAMACEISFKEGNTWVDFYRHLHQRRLQNDPILGLQYITEVRGNQRYAPKYTCSLCDISPLSYANDIYSHLHTVQHLEKYLNLAHPEKILGNEQLSSNLLSKQEHNKVIRDIAYQIGSVQTEKENIKVGVLLIDNVWRIWHEQCQGNSQQQAKQDDYSNCVSAGALKLRPQLYDLIRNSTYPICGLGSITEIQNDSALTKYQCDLCHTSSINQKNVVSHLRGRKHRRLYVEKKGLDNHRVLRDMDFFLRNYPDTELITVKKLLYLDLQGQNVYSVPELMKDPGVQPEEKKSVTEPVIPATSITQVTQETVSSSQKATTTATSTATVTTTAVTTSVNVADKAKGKDALAQRPTRFDKIVKGLDYTPLLGIEFMREVQSASGKYMPIYECELCNQRGRSSQLCPKNILRHLGTKGHRLSFIQKKHIAAYTDIKSVLGKRDREKKLDQHTKEIASKFGRGQIQVRVETDPLYFDKNSYEADVDSNALVIGNSIPELAGHKLPRRGRPDLKPGRQMLWKVIEKLWKVDEKVGNVIELHGTSPPAVVFILVEESFMGHFTKKQLRNMVLDNVVRAHETYPSAQLVWVDNPKWMKDNIPKRSAKESLGEKWKRLCTYGLSLVERLQKGENVTGTVQEDSSDDEVIITKVETKQTAGKQPSTSTGKQTVQATSPVEPKKSPITEPEALESLPKEPSLDLDKYISVKDYDANVWQKENEWIQENMKCGLLVPSSRCSKFVADYNSSFCTYPIIGLQWITEFHKSTTVWWCVCRLCEETVSNPKYLNNHISSLKHRLRYIQKKYPPIYLALKREQFTARNESLLRAKVYKHSQDIMKTECKEFKPEVMLQNCTKPRPVISSTKKVNQIETIATKTPRSDFKSATKKVTSPSANIVVVTSNTRPDKSKQEGTPQKRSNIETTDSPVSKKLRMDSGDAVSSTKDGTPGTRNDIVQAGEDAPQTEEEKQIGDVITIWDDMNDETGTEATPLEEIQQINRSKETVDFRGLKRKAVEDTEIQTKTPDLKADIDDVSDDDEIKIKKSKVDHKRRGYRDSYGTSYGQELDRKRDSSRSTSSRHSSSSRHRRSSRDRRDPDRRDSDRYKSRKPSSRDDTRTSKSSPKSKDVRSERKKSVEKAEVIPDKEEDADEGEGDDDFDAFIMAQLGEDFVTVDEIEDMEDLGEVKDDEDTSKDREEDANQTKKEQSKEDGQNLKEVTDSSESLSAVKSSDSTVSANDDKDANIQQEARTDIKGDIHSVKSVKVDSIEVSVELDEQKSPEKSNKSAKKATVPSNSRPLRYSNVQVEVQIEGDNKTDSPSTGPNKVEPEIEDGTVALSIGPEKEQSSNHVRVINPKSITAKTSVCPFLGIPITSSHSTEQYKPDKENMEDASNEDNKEDKIESALNVFEIGGTTSTEVKVDTSRSASVVVEIGYSGSTTSEFGETFGDRRRGFVTVDIAEPDTQATKKGAKKVVKKKGVAKNKKGANKAENGKTVDNIGDNKDAIDSKKGDQNQTIEKEAEVKIDDDKVIPEEKADSQKSDSDKSKDDEITKNKDKDKSADSQPLKVKEETANTKTPVKRQVKSVGKSKTETPSPSTRQTRSSRVTVITMEMEETSPKKAKTDSNVKDKKGNECEVSIEIG